MATIASQSNTYSRITIRYAAIINNAVVAMFTAVIDGIYFAFSVVNVITIPTCGGFACRIDAGHIRAVVYFCRGAGIVTSTAMVDVVRGVVAFVIAF